MTLEVVSTSLRKRNAIAGYGRGEADVQRTDFFPEHHTKPVQKKKRKGNPSPFELLSCLIHFAALSFIVWGFTLQSNFHTGDECEMTYSMLNYIPIESPKSAHYKLYKFVDSRDARNPGIIHTKNDITDSSHCTVNASIVVYIPGHWGSYTQCRSLGAHGTKLTRRSHTRDYTKKAYQSLADGTWNGVVSEEENFVFDTYCIDFAEQGAGSHGNMIRKQADFVARVVEKLTLQCSVPHVTLVGHSIGGLVAKSVPIFYPSTRDRIRTIITLATPHHRSPYAFDESMKEIYNKLKISNSSILVASISGGLKDELIPPSLCEIENNMSHVGGKLYGMDHKAIVWCHEILSVVRKTIFILSNSNATIGNRISSMREADMLEEDYQSQIAVQKAKYLENNGFVMWIALECSMIYNAELMLATFSLFCAFTLIWPEIKQLFLSVIVALMANSFSNHGLHFISHLTLALLSSAITMTVNAIILYLPFKSKSEVPTFRSSFIAACAIISMIFAGISLTVVTIQTIQRKAIHIQPYATTIFSIFSWILISSLRLKSTDPRTTIFVSWSFVVMPFLIFGKATLFIWGVLDDYDDLDPRFIIQVATPISLRILIGRTSKCKCYEEQVIFNTAHLLHISLYLSTLFKVGEGYVVGYFLAGSAIIECIRILV